MMHYLLFLTLVSVAWAQIDMDWELVNNFYGSDARMLGKNNLSTIPYAALHMGYDDTPWMGGTQLISIDPTSGLFMWRLRSNPGFVATLHRHYGEVYAFTEEGCWGYLEHPDWLACKGDVVHETPGSVHTYYIPESQIGQTQIVIMTWGISSSFLILFIYLKEKKKMMMMMICLR
jgi:quercetin dioxygenase-like cupin family protein